MILTAAQKIKTWVIRRKQEKFQYWLERSKNLFPIRNEFWYVSNSAVTYQVEGVFIYYAVKRTVHYSVDNPKRYKPLVHRTFFSRIQGSALQQAVLFCERENRRNNRK